MRTSAIFFTLLACTLSVLAANVKVVAHSEFPKEFIVSTGHEVAGSPVETSPFQSKDTVVEVDIEFAKGNEIEGIVAGKNGHLFVGFKGDKLVWQKKPYTWEYTAINKQKTVGFVAKPGTHEDWTVEKHGVELVHNGHKEASHWSFVPV